MSLPSVSLLNRVRLLLKGASDIVGSTLFPANRNSSLRPHTVEDVRLLSEDVDRHLSEIRHAFWRKDLRLLSKAVVDG
jgi:hypothetical protein